MNKILSGLIRSALLSIAFMFLYQCEHAFNPELNVQGDDFVVQAILTNEIREQTIILSRTYKYSNSQSFSGISGAKVYVTRGNEKRVDFMDCGNGHYIYENTLNLKTGCEYILHIITPDGTYYSSSPQVIKKAPPIDSVFIVPEKVNKEYTNVKGKKIFEEIDGFSIRAVFSDNTDESEYLAYQINGYEQYFLVFQGGLSSEYSYLFCRRRTKFNRFNITSICNTKAMKKTRASARVAAYYQDYFDTYQGTDAQMDSMETQNLLSTGFQGMLIEIRQLSLTEENYNILQLVEKQSNSEYELFDPIMIRVPSNISCQTQPDKKAFGLFMISDVSKKNVFITYDADRGQMNIEQTNAMHDNVSMDCVRNRPPSDWIFPGTLEQD